MTREELLKALEESYKKIYEDGNKYIPIEYPKEVWEILKEKYSEYIIEVKDDGK